MECPSLVGPLPKAVHAYFCEGDTITFHEVEGLPWAAQFNPPRHLLVRGGLFANFDETNLLEFYREVARAIVAQIGDEDLNAEAFVADFSVTALRRYQGRTEFLPAISTPTATALFLRRLWSEKQPVSIRELWAWAKNEAARRDPYRIRQAGGTLLARSPAAHFVGQMTRAAQRFSRKFQWDIDWTIQDEMDASTLKHRTAYRVQGTWELLATSGVDPRGDSWHLHPVASGELRTADSIEQADLLVMGGWQTHISGPSPGGWFAGESREVVADVIIQGGYSARHVAVHGQRVPGVEAALAFGQWFPGEGHWQVLATLNAGLNPPSGPHPPWALAALMAGVVVEAGY